MKGLLVLLLALFLTFSFAACKKEETPAGITNRNAGVNAEQSASASSVYSASRAQAGAVVEDSTWPSGEIYRVPEWRGVTRFYGGSGSLDDYAERGHYTMSVVASEDSFFRYMDTLENAGFDVEDFFSPRTGRGCVAEGGLVRLEINQRQFGDEWGYQLDFELYEVGEWPDYDLPSFLFPIAGKTLIDDPVIYKPGDNLRFVYGVWVDNSGYNFQFTYTGLSMIQAMNYMKEVALKLTDGIYFDESALDYGGFGFIKGTCIWNGQKYFSYGEVVEEDRNTYNFYFGWSVNDMGW